MKEIEIKAHLKNIEAIKNKLLELGCELSKPIVQEDVIFLPKDIHFENISLETCVLRIRKQSDKNLLTLKKSNRNELVCLEEETTVGDAKATEEILKLLEYKEAVRVNKTRIKCNYLHYEICLDKVEGLGEFIEVEKISDEPEGKVLQELLDFLISLGIDPKDRVELGYDTLVYRKITESIV